MAIGSAVYVRNGNVVAGEDEIWWMPRNRVRGRRLVVLLHGQLQPASAWRDQALPKQAAFAAALRDAGLPMCSIYSGGPSWGNDVGVADVEALRVYANATWGTALDKIVVVAASMGVLLGLNYAQTYPSRVAAIGGVMPAGDIDDLRDNNRGGTAQANINSAWSPYVGGGLAPTDTSATKALPARANPSSTANATTIGTSGPIRFYYSSADTTVIPATVTTLATRIGASCTATQISSSLDHSDALFASVPMSDLIPFVDAHV